MVYVHECEWPERRLQVRKREMNLLCIFISCNMPLPHSFFFPFFEHLNVGNRRLTPNCTNRLERWWKKKLNNNSKCNSNQQWKQKRSDQNRITSQRFWAFRVHRSHLHNVTPSPRNFGICSTWVGVSECVLSSIECIIHLKLYESIRPNKCNVLIGLLHFVFPIIFVLWPVANKTIRWPLYCIHSMCTLYTILCCLYWT